MNRPWAGVALAVMLLAPHADPAAAQAPPSTLPLPVGEPVPFTADSGPLSNHTRAWQTTYATTVRIPGAAWLRLRFATADLPPGAYLLLTSELDGEQQRLDGPGVALWDAGSAYFNGESVRLELRLPPGSGPARVRLDHTDAGPAPDPLRGGPSQCGICGDDGRAPSAENWAGRLMPVGCTASIICEDSTAVTAGHCMTGTVLQFNVPPSLPGCVIVHPPVADQFPVILSTRRFRFDGIGDDWGVFRVGLNLLGESPYERYRQLRPIAAAPAAHGNIAELTGYGGDISCELHQTQQRSTGYIRTAAPAHYTFDTDLREGSSGSAIIVGGRVAGVVTHCAGSCTNYGTRIDAAPFAEAIAETMACDDQHTLSIAAERVGGGPLPAVTIVVSPADAAGAAGGPAPLQRRYMHAAGVALTAPSYAGPACLVGWTVGGHDQPGGTVLALTITAPTSAVARYAPDHCCTADWNRDTHPTSADITAYLADYLAAVISGSDKADIDRDGQVTSSDLAAFLSVWQGAVAAGC